MPADNPGDDPLTASLAAYDDALASGARPPSADVPPELRPRFDRARGVLDLLERAYPRAPLPTGVPATIGRFRVRSLLGQGGFGVVFLADDPNLNRPVALKIPHASSLVDPRLRQRFLGEAEIMAGLSHPGVVQVHEAGDAGGLLYIASEYVAGPTLAAWLAGRRGDGHPPAPPGDAARLVLALAGAVEFLHSRGVLHRDLKPSNVLLSPASAEGEAGGPLGRFDPKITDFGLAKHLAGGGHETRSGAALGTPGYAAPEQAEGRAGDVGAHTDVYALGAVLYELLTGRTPCSPGVGPPGWADVLRNEVASPSRHAPVPRDLETVCLKALDREVGRRYPSARELIDDLGRYLDGRPVRARPVGPAERLLKWVRRRPALAALLGLGAAVLLALGGAAWRMRELAGEAQERGRDLRATRKTAEVNRYHSLVFRAQEAMNSRPLGWVDQALKDLGEAASLPTEARDPVVLRSLVARCLAGIDLRRAAVLAEGVDAFCLAFSPDGRLLAVGDRSGEASCDVLVYDVETRRLVYTLRCPALSPRETGVAAMAFHPSRPWLAVGTRHGEAHCWDLAGSPPQRRTFQAHQGRVTRLLFLPGTDVLASASTDGSVKFWDVLDRPRLRKEHALRGTVREMAYQPEPGRLFLDGIAAGIGSYRVEHAGPETVLVEDAGDRAGGAAHVAVSPDGLLRVFTRRDVLVVRNRTGSRVRLELELPHPYRPAFADEMNHMEFHPGSSLLATGSADHLIKLWELASGRLALEMGVPGIGNVYPAFSPDGKAFAFVEDRKTVLCDLLGLEVQRTVAHHTHTLRAFAFSADGEGLACFAQESGATKADRTGQLTRWDLATGKCLLDRATEPPKGPVAWGQPSLAHHPGGGLAFTVQDAQGVQRYGEGEGRAFPAVPLSQSLAFSPSGRRLWGGLNWRQDGDQRRVKPDYDHVVSVTWPDLREASRWAHRASPVREVKALAAGDRWVVAGTHNGWVKLLRAADGQLERDWPSPKESSVRCVALAADESLAAAGTQTGKLQVVRVPDGASVAEATAHADSLDALAFSPDGRTLASGGRDRKAHLWRVEGGSLTRLATLTFDAGVVALAFHPGGHTLGVLCHDEYAVRLWRLDRLNERLERMGLGW
jgi:eukaryotic-like serine/threonine-protein kinase